jgi:Rrf2 family protein
MLSQKSRYALKALLVLAGRGDTDPMQISDIADTAHVPRKFLEQILLELKKPGIVCSHRGRLGGYSLGRAAKDISFADVLRVTDGPLALSPCVSVMAYRKCDDCFDEAICGIRKALLAARDATAEVLESRSLAAAAAQMRRSGAL